MAAGTKEGGTGDASSEGRRRRQLRSVGEEQVIHRRRSDQGECMLPCGKPNGRRALLASNLPQMAGAADVKARSVGRRRSIDRFAQLGGVDDFALGRFVLAAQFDDETVSVLVEGIQMIRRYQRRAPES